MSFIGRTLPLTKKAYNISLYSWNSFGKEQLIAANLISTEIVDYDNTLELACPLSYNFNIMKH
jgi:uncharacterized membrane protein YccF (DUF307 family)